jgi:hypothetical protein
MGVFVYKTKGKFPDKFIMEAVDVFLMAKGVAAEVGYTTDAKFFSDLDEAGLLEDSKGNFYSRALIHSHQNMGTSFSGTDYDQLKKGADNAPYYLSVVVNNAMDFTAKVAIQSKEVLTGYSYFKTPNNKEVKKAKTTTKNSFEIVEVEVECHWPQYMIDVDSRMKVMQNYTIPKPDYSHWQSQNWNTPKPAQTSGVNTLFGDDWANWERPVTVQKALEPTPSDIEQLDLEMYEAASQMLESIVPVLKNKYKDPENFANAFIKASSEAGIDYQILLEYAFTSEMVNDVFDEKVCEILESKIEIHGK